MHLRDWIKKEGEGSISRLAKKIHVSRQSVHNYIDSSKSCPSLPKAYEIEIATGGKVDLYSWVGEKVKTQKAQKSVDSLSSLM